MNSAPPPPARSTLFLSRRVIVVAILLPACCAALDHWLLSRHLSDQLNLPITASMLGVFVTQVGLLGVLCGRWIESPLLRGIVYTWCWVLIDMQTLTASVLTVDSSYHSTGDPTAVLLSGLFAAQLGLVIIWAVFGTFWWGLRWPAALLLGAMLAVPLSNTGQNIEGGSYLFVLQALVLVATCAVLRARRFLLVPPGSDSVQRSGAGNEQSHQGLRSMQFGLRHVLIWTTSLAILLAIARAFDLLSTARLSLVFGNTWMWLVTAGLLVAIVQIVALWAALGVGAAWLRVSLLVIVSTTSGMVLMFATSLAERLNSRLFRATHWDYVWAMAANYWSIAVWVTLTGALLYAALLIYRTLGYRLSR